VRYLRVTHAFAYLDLVLVATRISGIISFGFILEYSGNSGKKFQTETRMRPDWNWNKFQKLAEASANIGFRLEI
jgi:hypothetical protein